MKTTYVDAKRKKKVRNFLIKKFNFDEVVGLAGPDINEYINNIRFKDCNKIRIYETSASTLYKQLTEINTSKKEISLSYSDIYNAVPNKEGVLYDLDFCATARSLKDHIKKFKDNFIMTFSLRKCGFKETIDIFFKARRETVLSTVKKLSPIPHTIFNTNKGKYIYCAYHDTTTMCCIAKIR